MTSTRDLVVYVLENDARVRDWAQQKYSFTLDKARTADLANYGDLVAEIIADGKKAGTITEAQVQGSAPLSS